MTPDAVAVLHEVAAATRESTAAIVRSADATAALEKALVADQAAARETLKAEMEQIREETRGRFTIIYLALIVMLVGVGAVVVGDWQDRVAREDRSRVAEAQRQCDSVVHGAVLSRLVSLAVVPRFKTDAEGHRVLDGNGNPIPLTQAELLAQADALQRDALRANESLTHVRDVCYDRPGGPDPTPLDLNDN